MFHIHGCDLYYLEIERFHSLRLFLSADQVIAIELRFKKKIKTIVELFSFCIESVLNPIRESMLSCCRLLFKNIMS